MLNLNQTILFILSSLFQISTKSLLKCSVPGMTCVRSFWETFPYFRPLFHEKDGLKKDKYELIYHARIFNYSFWAQLGAMTLIVSEIYGGMRYAYNLLFSPEVVHAVNHIGPFVIDATNLSSILAITLFNVQGIVMIIAAQTSVMRIYFCEETDEYVFVKLGFNPFKTRLLRCYPGELHQLKEKPFDFLFGNHILNREKIFIRSDNFKSTHLYNNLLSKSYE